MIKCISVNNTSNLVPMGIASSRLSDSALLLVLVPSPPLSESLQQATMGNVRCILIKCKTVTKLHDKAKHFKIKA